MPPRTRSTCTALLILLSGCLILVAVSARGSGQPQSDRLPETVLVLVNGEKISEGDLQFLMLWRQLSENLRPGLRKRLMQQLIDRRLMRAFLEKRKAPLQPRAVEAQVTYIHKIIRQAGDDPKDVLGRLGYADEKLHAEVSLPLAWQVHARRIITAERIREHFRQHRQQFDGTRARASQIFLKVSSGNEADSPQAAEKKLQNLRDQIVGGQLSFSEAARKYSEAPSAKQGGDVGFFPYRGKMPVAFSEAAFPLKNGEVSQPFRTRFGVHLLTVTKRRAGQLSLEDVRTQVFKVLANREWNRIVGEERKRAKIEWKTDLD